MSEDQQGTPSGAAYVLVTAAWNEEKQIATVIRSVVAQTVSPLRWVIVSDGSTDRTDDIIQEYAGRYDFIRLYRIEKDHPRNFAAQVDAINAGFAELKHTNYNYIGNLDSDVSFEPTYFAKLLGKFAENPRLGLAGGYICEEQKGEFRPRAANNPRSVPHAVQLFRRECFEAIGQYARLPYGGPDWHAEVMCRMHGWQVESYADLRVFHHRPTGAAEGRLRSWYRQGLMDFSFGSQPLFEIAKLARRIRSRPFLLGALVRLCAFTGAYFRQEKRAVPEEFVEYLRKEQWGRIWPFGRTKSCGW